MPYNNFTIDEVEDKFGLVFKSNPFIPNLNLLFPSGWLRNISITAGRGGGFLKSSLRMFITP
jgi:hypothetical protein